MENIKSFEEFHNIEEAKKEYVTILQEGVNEGNTITINNDFDVIRIGSGITLQRDKGKKGHFEFSDDSIDDLINALQKLKR